MMELERVKGDIEVRLEAGCRLDLWEKVSVRRDKKRRRNALSRHRGSSSAPIMVVRSMLCRIRFLTVPYSNDFIY